MDSRAGRVSRRSFIASGAVAAGWAAFGPRFWAQALAAPAQTGPNPYGELRPPDANGLMLPPGFSSREIARANQPVADTGYSWHIFADGQATFRTEDGGWILTQNSESVALAGAGTSAIRFGADGQIADAYRILGDTNANCAGGPTPWGTWLSCEEYDDGHVWECDPTGANTALIRPALGTFLHEAACVDPVGKHVFMTEDEPDGGFYRFTPAAYPDLSSGLLEVAVVAADNRMSWREVPDPAAITAATRTQVPDMTRFNGGEGIWYDSGNVYFSTKGDDRVWVYDTRSGLLDTIYDPRATPDPPLTGVDNVTVSRSGDVYVCEDGGNMEIAIITPERVVAPFLRLTGAPHDGSEMTGVIFDPSGTRMYFSSQRGHRMGVTYEVSGPFRGAGAPGTSSVPLASGEQLEGGRPPLRVRARRRIGLPTLLRDGIQVRVTAPNRGEITVALRTSDLELRRGARGSADRPVRTTLARRKLFADEVGGYPVTLRPRRAVRRRLRNRPLDALISVHFRAANGGSEVETLPLAIVARRRHRARRRHAR